jgi:hypothetical protein
VYRLFRQLLDVCLLRAGPQDLPYSPALARGLIVLQVGVNLLYAASTDMPQPVARIAVADGVLLGVAWAVLAWRGRTPRAAQTISALFGCSLVFLLALMPLTWLALALTPDPALAAAAQTAVDPRRVVLSLAMLALLGWKMMVNGHVFRHAYDWPHGAGILLALGLFMLQQGLDQLLFSLPEPVR